MSIVRLNEFDSRRGLNRGKSKFCEVLWYVVKCCFFLTPLPWPTKMKKILLRLFGAKVGKGGNIKPRVNIHFPWKLEIGDHVWIGEEVFILNFEPVILGNQVCVSQRAFLCTGNHDFKSPFFDYRNASVKVSDGVWIGASAFIGPGVNIGEECVVMAGSIATKSLRAKFICRGNPCEEIKYRWSEGA